MDLSAINSQIDQVLSQLKAEGLLDEQFSQLMALQDDSNPDFVAEVVELYFEDSASKLDKLEAKLAVEAVDYNEIDQLVHQFKGSSASFGAQVIAQLCVSLRETCQQQNAQGCRAYLAQTRERFGQLKSKLQVFMTLEAQRKAMGGGNAGGAGP